MYIVWEHDVWSPEHLLGGGAGGCITTPRAYHVAVWSNEPPFQMTHGEPIDRPTASTTAKLKQYYLILFIIT